MNEGSCGKIWKEKDNLRCGELCPKKKGFCMCTTRQCPKEDPNCGDCDYCYCEDEGIVKISFQVIIKYNLIQVFHSNL